MAKNKTKGKIRSKSKGRKHSRKSKKSSNSTSVSYDIDLDMTDKSLRDFQASKSITVATTKSDITSSKIGELYEVKPIQKNIQQLCQLKVAGKIAKEYPNGEISNHIPRQICKCIFERNSGLRIAELEKLVKSRLDTPASSCISILDQNSKKSKSQTSRKSKESRSSS